jgi:hypothetical protein
MVPTEVPEQKSEAVATPRKKWTFKRVVKVSIALFFAAIAWDMVTPRWAHVFTDKVHYTCMDGEDIAVDTDRWTNKPTMTKGAACVGHNHPKPAPAPSPAPAEAQPSAPAKTGAKLLLTDHVKYEYGYVTVTGTVKNIGDNAAFSPSVKVEVYDDSGGTLLAQSEGNWPAGQFFTHMKPGVSAAFEAMEHIPGEPNSIRVRVSIEKYPYEEIRN